MTLEDKYCTAAIDAANKYLNEHIPNTQLAAALAAAKTAAERAAAFADYDAKGEAVLAEALALADRVQGEMTAADYSPEYWAWPKLTGLGGGSPLGPFETQAEAVAAGHDLLRKQTAIQCMNITIGHDGPIVARAVR
jgi:hypothetical protein